MSDRYAAGLLQTGVSTVVGTTGTDAAGEMVSAATVRPCVYDILFGQGSTPADNSVRWEVTRRSAAGSVAESAVVENLINPASPAAVVTAFEELTVGPTVTADSQLLDFDLNQRATFRWVAAPGGELIAPATAANGLVFNCSSAAYTGIARATIHWEE